MVDPYPLFPTFAFLGFIITIIPLPWHLEAWNSGTVYYMLWTSIACLNQFVNSVVWHGNALNPAPVWCDISTRIMLGASVGIPAASLCINMRLYKIAAIQTVTIDRAEKRRAILIDTLICVLFPIICIALAYIVQGHRFDIYEDIGCYPVILDTVPAYFLVYMWPILIGLISFVFCALSIRAFAQRRAQFSEFLNSNNSSLTVSRYFRLMALASTEMCCTVPIALFVLIYNLTTQSVDPWHGWADAHFGFSRVDQVPSVLWRMNHMVVVSFELSRWLNVVCALVFFAFFGFASEARRNYRRAIRIVLRRVGLEDRFSRLRSFGGKIAPMHGSLPIYAPRMPMQTVDSDGVSISLPSASSKTHFDAYSSTTTFQSAKKGYPYPPPPSTIPSPSSTASFHFSELPTAIHKSSS